MTPHIFNLGDEVEVIGTSAKFTITQIQQLPDDERKYSDIGMPYYRANFLKLVNEKPLSPMLVTYNYKPDDYEHGTIRVSCPCGRKAEIALPEKSEWEEVPTELKIGDWVRYEDIIFQISDISPGEPFCLHRNGRTFEKWYNPAVLRKLTPEEIKQHTTIGAPVSQYPITPATDFDELTLRDVARMSGICKNEHGVWICTLLKRMHDAEKRLTFIEKFQRDQDDPIGRAIRDGAVEISDFRRSG